MIFASQVTRFPSLKTHQVKYPSFHDVILNYTLLETSYTFQVDDCRVSVIDNNPSDWLSLKLTCDNHTSCSYEYLGSAIDECEEDYLADYMQIYYDCGDGKHNQFV